MLQNLKEYRE